MFLVGKGVLLPYCRRLVSEEVTKMQSGMAVPVTDKERLHSFSSLQKVASTRLVQTSEALTEKALLQITVDVVFTKSGIMRDESSASSTKMWQSSVELICREIRISKEREFEGHVCYILVGVVV